MKKSKFYFSNGTRDYVSEWINNSEWSIPTIMLLMILACGWLGC